MSKENLLKQLTTDSQKLLLEDVHRLLADELSKDPEKMDAKLVELCAEAIENAEKKRKLAAVLKNDSMKLALEDVQKIMAEELAKDPEKMDPDLIDLCAEALENAEKGKKLIAALRSESVKMTAEDVRQIMAEELSKDPKEMDTDLIDLCAEALENAEKTRTPFIVLKGGEELSPENARQNETAELSKVPHEANADTAELCAEKTEAREESKEQDSETPDGKKGKSIKSLLFLIAIAAALLVALLPSIASKISIRAEKDVVALGDNGDFIVGVKKGDTEADENSKEESPLLCALREAGVEDPVLPSKLLDSSLKFKVQKTSEKSDYSVVSMDFTDPAHNKSGFVRIKSFNRPISEQDLISVNSYLGDVHQTRVDELDALSFSEEDNAYTCYTSGNTLYTIFLADTM